MKPSIHPTYKEVQITCSCGNAFVTRSTIEDRDKILLEVCSACHPFYTGTQKIVDTAGRVDRFRQKYGTRGKDKDAEDKKK
jgi:large subunit ribosomal protein L31